MKNILWQYSEFSDKIILREVMISPAFFFFFKDFIYLPSEREERREKKRERNIIVWLPFVCSQLGTWPATQACALTGNQTGNPSICRLALRPLSHTSQGSPAFFKGIFLRLKQNFKSKLKK